MHERRDTLASQRQDAAAEQTKLETQIAALTNDTVAALDARIATAVAQLAAMPDPFSQDGDPSGSPTNGYHSEISSTATAAKWVQVDLGESLPIEVIRLVPARPTDFARYAGLRLSAAVSRSRLG